MTQMMRIGADQNSGLRRWSVLFAVPACEATYEEIARQIGYKSPSGAMKAVLSGVNNALHEPAAFADR
jgi:hypothetical protein